MPQSMGNDLEPFASQVIGTVGVRLDTDQMCERQDIAYEVGELTNIGSPIDDTIKTKGLEVRLYAGMAQPDFGEQ